MDLADTATERTPLVGVVGLMIQVIAVLTFDYARRFRRHIRHIIAGQSEAVVSVSLTDR
jgi:hypothetical protein